MHNENKSLQRDSNLRHATLRQVNQRFIPLGHDALMMMNGLMSYKIMGYHDLTTLVELIMVTCVFELNVRLNLHVLSQCRFYLV